MEMSKNGWAKLVAPLLLLLLLPSCSQCSAPSCWVKGGVQRQRSLSFTIFFWQILRANSSSHFPLHLHIHTLLVLKLGAAAYLQLSFTIFFRLLLQVISQVCIYLQRRTYKSKFLEMSPCWCEHFALKVLLIEPSLGLPNWARLKMRS